MEVSTAEETPEDKNESPGEALGGDGQRPFRLLEGLMERRRNVTQFVSESETRRVRSQPWWRWLQMGTFWSQHYKSRDKVTVCRRRIRSFTSGCGGGFLKKETVDLEFQRLETTRWKSVNKASPVMCESGSDWWWGIGATLGSSALFNLGQYLSFQKLRVPGKNKWAGFLLCAVWSWAWMISKNTSIIYIPGL